MKSTDKNKFKKRLIRKLMTQFLLKIKKSRLEKILIKLRNCYQKKLSKMRDLQRNLINKILRSKRKFLLKEITRSKKFNNI